MKFIDEVEIKVASGHGGPGRISFWREKFRPRGGPDGGDGGKGGDIVFRVNPQLNSLLDLRFKRDYAAKDGEQGGQSDKSGSAGESLIIQVPPGTVIRTTEGELLADLSEKSAEILLLEGGRGGKGNAFFKTSVNQAPDYAQPGEEGKSLSLKLELKLLADIGIIGFPNAGKSTLISRISAARPKIADYPFTTLVPNLGVVRLAEGRSMVVADIPGLIPGAHKGAGLGHRFLKHIERTKGFVHLIDATEFSGRDPVQDYEDINLELARYDELQAGREGFNPLSHRPQLVILNKIDGAEREKVEEHEARFKVKGVKVMLISAATGAGIRELIFKMGGLLGDKGQEA